MKKDTSWEKVGAWYDKTVGKHGSYYHEKILFPQALRLLNPEKTDSVLDLGCGNGAWARNLPKDVEYVGIDIAESLIKKAKSYSKKHHFFVDDAMQVTCLGKKRFSIITFFLSLQNMANLDQAIHTAKVYAKPKAKLLLVLNHPCFRIPRKSSWVIDPEQKEQSRKIKVYMEPQDIPIVMHPSQKDSAVTYSFHRNLQTYVKTVAKHGFVVLDLEEWISPKTSTGRFRKMENRCRKNFPLFLALLCEKVR